LGSNYFQGKLDDIERYGFRKITVFENWPYKITLKAALMLAERIS